MREGVARPCARVQARSGESSPTAELIEEYIMKAVFVLLAALEAVKLADAKEKVETSFEVDAALEHLQNLW